MKGIILSILVGFALSYVPFFEDKDGKNVESFFWIISGIIKTVRN